MAEGSESSDRRPDAPRHAADAARRRRVTGGRSSRLGRGRRRRADGLPGDSAELDDIETAATAVTDATAETDVEDVEAPSRVHTDQPAPTGSTAATVVDDPSEPPADAEPPVATDPVAVDERPASRHPSTEPAKPTAAADEPTGPDRLHGRQRLGSALSRPGRGQVIAAVLLILFGFAVVTQIRIITEDSTYANARREDLIQLLDGLTQENRRLEGELSDLERTRTNLQSGADAQQVAREEAERRIEVLSILAGTVPAEGQGIRMVISDPQNKVTAEILLDAVQEMRDAGAEVIEINDSIRLVASSWFGTGPTGLVVDGKPVTKPIVIEVIGDPHSLSEGANFRGGIVSEISSSKVGGTVSITELENVVIDSLHTPKTNQYARPASPEPTR